MNGFLVLKGIQKDHDRAYKNGSMRSYVERKQSRSGIVMNYSDKIRALVINYESALALVHRRQNKLHFSTIVEKPRR